MKKTSAILLGSGLLAAFMTMPARAAQVNLTASNITQLNSAMATAESNPGNTYLITLSSGTFELTQTYRLTKGKVEIKGTITWPAGSTLSGKVMKKRIFSVVPATGYAPRLWITGLTVSGGEEGANGGGCIWVERAEVVISHSVVEKCVSSLSGAGIYAYDARLNIFQSHIRENRNLFYEQASSGAQANGGGVFANGNTVLDIYRSTFSANKCNRGGAVMIAGNTALNMTNSTLSGNYAIRGAGLMVRGTGNVRLHFNTIYNNHAGQITGDEPRVGGGILFDAYAGILNFQGNIVAGNDNLNGPDSEFYPTEGDDCYVHKPEVGRWSESTYYTNVIGKLDESCNWRLGHFMVYGIGGQTWPFDPKLGPLTTNGTGYGAALPNHLPLTGSPVRASYYRDYGPGNTPNGTGMSCPTSDGRARPRRAAPGVCDIGAIAASGN